MGGSSSQPKAPKAPNPNQVAKQQTKLNTDAAQTQQKLNMVDQTTPFGSLTYKSDPNAPGGYSAVVALSPEQQAILDQQQKFGLESATTGTNQMQNVAQTLSTPLDLSPSAVENNLMSLAMERYTPLWNQQESQLDTKLRNQGLVPGDPAYDQEILRQKQSENDLTNQLMLSGYNTGMNTLLTARQEPLKEMQALEGTPIGNPSFGSTPNENVAPANYGSYAYSSADLANQQYLQQLASNQQQSGALYGALGNIGGSLLSAGVPGGGSLGGWGIQSAIKAV